MSTMTNEELVQKYPWLGIYDHNGNLNTEYTWLDQIPDGWRKAFGTALVEDIQGVLDQGGLEGFKLELIKEKYGELVIYTSVGNEELFRVLSAYRYISGRTCIDCGRVPVNVYDDGWMCPYCEEHKPSDSICRTSGPVEKSLVWREYGKDGEKEVTLDLRPYYKKIGFDTETEGDME